MKRRLADYAPPGAPVRAEVLFLLWGLGLSALYSLWFLSYFFRSRTQFLNYDHIPDVILAFESFDFFLHETRPWLGYAVLASAMAALAFGNYGYHYQGSKSIYLMRRLPDARELHRRCLALPLFGIVLCAILCLLTLGVFSWVYHAFAPTPLLPTM